jgi:hypothetical protein
MKTVLLFGVLLGWPWMLQGQRLTLAGFRELGQAWAPEANGLTLLALARTESNLNPWALSVNRAAGLARRMGYGQVYLKYQPGAKAETVRWARELEATAVTSAWEYCR